MAAKLQNSTIVSDIYHSRIHILEILKSRGFYVDDYTGNSINEINILRNNDQLDLLLSNKEDDKKIFVKYHEKLEKKLRPPNIYDYVEELFNTENLLTTRDELVIVTKDKPNDTIIKVLNNLYKSENIYVNVFHIKAYLFNILKHSLVPPHRVLKETEKLDVKKKYGIQNDKEFPEISRFDPVAIAIGLRPDELCEITRASPTSISSFYYRLCY